MVEHAPACCHTRAILRYRHLKPDCSKPQVNRLVSKGSEAHRPGFALRYPIMVVIIALLHCLPPILGALIGGREGLATGTIIGVICAFVFGALVLVRDPLLYLIY